MQPRRIACGMNATQSPDAELRTAAEGDHQGQISPALGDHPG
jgi:hypothetical protein